MSYIFGFESEKDYEDAILDRQEFDAGECAGCRYKYECRNQCEEVEEHYNPNLPPLDASWPIWN